MEMELRIVDIDVCDIRKKLKELNCLNIKKENQTNYLYDFSNKKLLNNKGYARIRVVYDILHNKEINYMTVKKLISNDTYKIMEEHETEINSFEKGQEIFNALGLNLIQTIKKYRESYKFKSTLIEIDINDKSFCPFPYIEIEGNSKEEILEIVSILGYTMKDTTSKTIYQILKEKGVRK